MNPMQRRHFLKTALIGTGAAAALAVPVAFAANHSATHASLQTLLMRLEGDADAARWQRLDQCRSDACAASTRTRMAIERLQFPVGYSALTIEAMFATAHGIRPFRMATYQPGSLSPVSKPFAFDVDANGLAGFRAEQARGDDGSLAVASSALLGAARPTLADGRYLLLLSRDAGQPDSTTIAVSTHATDAVLSADGTELPFACIAFSVQRLA